MMKHKAKWLIIGILITLCLSGCDSLVTIPGSGTSTPTTPASTPFADGFDFPVGDRDGKGWGVTGYDFLEWSNYSNSWHPGEDWNMLGSAMADWGAPVYSIANGIVVFSGWNTAQGNIILIEHHLPNGSKVWSQYAHLEERYVSAGEIVGRRQLIGTVGRGPNNTFSPHLHFEIRKQYLPQNAWPRTNGQPWTKAQVLEYYLDPTDYITAHRPTK